MRPPVFLRILLQADADNRVGEYYAVNQILSKQLHNADEECLAYTTDLMDRLEKVRGSPGSQAPRASTQADKWG